MKEYNNELYIKLINHNVPEEVIYYYMNYLKSYYPQFNTQTKIAEMNTHSYRYNIVEFTDNIRTQPTVKDREGFIWGIVKLIGYMLNNQRIISYAQEPIIATYTDKIERSLDVITFGYNFRYTPQSPSVPFYMKAAYWPSADKLFVEIK